MTTPFTTVIGIVGHPTTADVAWTDEQLAAIRDLGVNTLQLSIAWAWRPAGEVLNLENFADPGNSAEWRRRVDLAGKFGFRTLTSSYWHIGLTTVPDSGFCLKYTVTGEQYYVDECERLPARRWKAAGRIRASEARWALRSKGSVGRWWFPAFTPRDLAGQALPNDDSTFSWSGSLRSKNTAGPPMPRF